MNDKSGQNGIDRISEWIGKLKFKRKWFGGVDEDDVLKKMGELNQMYEVALIEERARYNALLDNLKGGETHHGE